MIGSCCPHASACIFFFYGSADHRDLHSSLHDALPIWVLARAKAEERGVQVARGQPAEQRVGLKIGRDTSELQSQFHLVCRLLLEKKKVKSARLTCRMPGIILLLSSRPSTYCFTCPGCR